MIEAVKYMMLVSNITAWSNYELKCVVTQNSTSCCIVILTSCFILMCRYVFFIFQMNNEPLSLAKAKRDGLKMAKLPLDRYLEWAPGSKKNLNINHMIPILLDLKLTRDWEYALRHIPRRKLLETKILAMQNKLKNPLLKDEVIKNFKKYSNLGPLKNNPLASFRDRRSKSRKSLYDDDSI